MKYAEIEAIVNEQRSYLGSKTQDANTALTVCGHLLFSFALEVEKSDKRRAELLMRKVCLSIPKIAEGVGARLTKQH